MKENWEGINGQFKKCSILKDVDTHYPGSSEAINLNTPDYLRGLSDGYKEGYNAAFEQLHFLSQQQPMRIEISAEKLEELQKSINEIPMPIHLFNEDDWKPIIGHSEEVRGE